MAETHSQLSTRDWSTLPDLPLATILRLLLPSHRDLIAFSAVCRPFCSLLSDVTLIPFLPPLLFNPNSTSTILSPSSPSIRFNLSLVSPSLLSSHRCLAYSHGYLILLPRLISPHLSIQPVIVNVITASQIDLPPLPSNYCRFPHYYATLTAPPSSPSCLVLLFFSKFSFLSCAFNQSDDTWKLHRYSSPNISYVSRVVTFRGRIFGINDQAKLLEFNFGNSNGANPIVQVSNIRGAHHKPRDFDTWHFGPQLVCTPNQLILVLFLIYPKKPITIYSLDLKKMEWVEVNELRDFAIFIDCGGKAPVSCEKPELWGGKSNCLYVAGPGCKTWRCISLDEKTILPRPPLSGVWSYEARWPSPIWIQPSLFF